MSGSGNGGDDLFTQSPPKSHSEAPFAFAEKFSLASPWPSMQMVDTLAGISLLGSLSRGGHICSI